MEDPGTQDSEQQAPLPLGRMIEILDSIDAFERTWGADVRDFYLSGGDPFLHDQWHDLLAELRKRGKVVALLGNPETLTVERAKRLADLNAAFLQMSLDGLKETHDTIRGRGSFARTIEKLELLASCGIPGHVMFTLFPDNADELVPLLRFVARETPASSFAFDIGCKVGRASKIGACLTASRLSEIFADYLEAKACLQGQGHPLIATEKPNLLRLSRLTQGAFFPVRASGLAVVAGCLCGWAGVSILPDGTVLACRRLPIPVGRMPEQSFEDIFLGAPLMRRFRRRASFAMCSDCDLYPYCRGCPAYVYSVAQGDPFADYPLCFRSEASSARRDTAPDGLDVSLDASYEAEYDLVARRFSTTAASRIPRLLQDEDTKRVFLNLAYSPQDRRAYLADPYGAVAAKGICLSDETHVFLMQHFTSPSASLADNVARDILAEAVVEQMLRPEPRTEKSGLRTLMTRAWADDAFRTALLASPRTVIESALGIRLPPDLEIQIHQQSAKTLHILLPGGPVGIPAPQDARKGKTNG